MAGQADCRQKAKKFCAAKLADLFKADNQAASRLAFTLAEVLITLGIIGVVAAVTMPVIVAKIQDRINITRWKKTYSILHNAYNQVKAQDIEVCATHFKYDWNKCSNGNPIRDLSYGYWNPEFMYEFLSKLKVVKTCGSYDSYTFTDYKCKDGVDAYVWYCNSGSCYTSLGGEYQIYRRGYAGKRSDISYKGPQSGSALGREAIDLQAVLLEDGTVLYFGGEGQPAVVADVNGWQKGPNMVGKDVFGVQLFENKMVPLGAIGSDGYDNSSYGSSGCSKDIGYAHCNSIECIAGAGCSYKYLND